jgi:Na+/phosphate symporter
MKGILKFWIFDRKSGFCLFEQTFEELPGNLQSDLIGGFMIAILSFAQEIAQQEIEYLQLKKLRISYHLSENCIICIATENETDMQETTLALDAVQKKFDEQYHQIFEEGHQHIVSNFNNFASDLEHIFDAETKHLVYIKKRSDRVNQFLQNGKQEMDDLQKMIYDRIKLYGEWKAVNLEEKEINVKNKVIEERNRAKNVMKEESKKKSGKWK